MNLKEMTTQDLQDLFAKIRSELASREDPVAIAVYTHDCHGCSNNHARKYKHWAKRVTAIDATKTNGYAWIGPWLQVQRENPVPVGSIVVEVCDTDIKAYRVTGDGEKEEIGRAKTNAPSSLIKIVADLL